MEVYGWIALGLLGALLWRVLCGEPVPLWQHLLWISAGPAGVLLGLVALAVMVAARFGNFLNWRI